MTSENSQDDGPEAGTTPRGEQAPASAVPTPGGGARRARPPALDWDREPGSDIDPEDFLRAPRDDLARLLDDVPPHHVEH